VEYLIAFLVFLVINAIILAVALAVATFLQSFQVGVLSTFAARAGGLLVVVTLVFLFVPFGFWVSLLVWFIGFWLALEIDPGAAGILTGVVFAMNILVWLTLFALLMPAAR
jgi:energy-converting hydrogenase Eha subunit B